jgi:hypothetical protein
VSQRMLLLGGVATGLAIITIGGVAIAELRLGTGSVGHVADTQASLSPTPAHFQTLAPGAALPSSAQCAREVLRVPIAENKRANAAFNRVTGQAAGQLFPRSDDARANTTIAGRVDGAFTGTTEQILRWTACKWGIDEDLVFAQAAVESWWRQTNLGDWGPNPAACAPGHAIGLDGRPGLCPQSYGIMQNRYSLERSTWPAAERSTAMNADAAYAIWRACFEGYEVWLNSVEHAETYTAGDVWGCIGRWFAGRWHTNPATVYIAKVKEYLDQRIWEQPRFQEP